MWGWKYPDAGQFAALNGEEEGREAGVVARVHLRPLSHKLFDGRYGFRLAPGLPAVHGEGKGSGWGRGADPRTAAW